MTGKVMRMYGSDVWEQCETGYHDVKIISMQITCCIKRMYMSSGEHYGSEIHIKWFLGSWPTGHNVPHS